MYVAQQLGFEERAQTLLDQYAARQPTISEHTERVKKYLGFRTLGSSQGLFVELLYGTKDHGFDFNAPPLRSCKLLPCQYLAVLRFERETIRPR